MKKSYRNLLMWSLYALLFLAAVVVQTVFFGDVRFWGVKLSLIPAVIACIAMHTDHEHGAVFSLAAALFWQATGANGGSLGLVTLTVTGVLTGWLCDSVFVRRLPLAVVFSACAVVLHEGCVLLLRCYLEQADWSSWLQLPIQAALILPAAPVFYFLAKAIRKAGAV